MQEHPKVVLATPVWSLNGPNIFSATLARGLVSRGIPAEIVITRPDWEDPKPMPRPADIEFRTLPVRPFIRMAARWREMIRYLEDAAPCLYLPNYDFGHSCVSPVLSGRVAIVGIVHSDDPQHYEHVLRLGPYWNAIVAVSTAIADEIAKRAPALSERVTVIPYGVAAPDTFPERRPAPAGPLRAVYAGRLDQKQKRVLDLPRIVRCALDQGIPMHLLIAGSGPAQAILRSECARLAVTAQVEFVGTLAAERLAQLLAGQHVFLLASAFEGLPIGVLEAMAQGCVPVASDVRSGIREVIADGVNGFLVKSGDVAGFASRLAELYREPELRRRMALAAFETIRSGRYRVEAMLESYLNLFERVLADSRSGRFRRPHGEILPPRELPWQERLPEAVQKAGHHARRLLRRGRN